MADQWQKMEVLEEKRDEVMKYRDQLMAELALVNCSLVSVDEEISQAQDKYNELSIELHDAEEEMMRGASSDSEDESFSSSEDEESDDDVSSCSYDDDYMCQPRSRKTIKDVLTPAEACKANKTSKSHKLKPRSAKRDRSKTPEKKAQSKRMKFTCRA